VGTNVFLFAIVSGSAVVSTQPPSPGYKAAATVHFHLMPKVMKDELISTAAYVIPNMVLD
jgi:hypothetical protein